MTAALACAVVFAVVLLLVRLVIWRERGESSLKKALGFTSSDISRAYLKKALLYVLPGAAAGVFAGLYPGQWLAGLLLGSMGAQGFQFIVDPVSTFLFVPALVSCTAAAAAAAGLAEIRRIRAEECLRTGTE